MKLERKKIALERIDQLFQLARDVIHQDEELAQKYVTIARQVAMASRVALKREYRQQICRGCKRFILPGVSSVVRTQSRREPHTVVTCGYCGRHMRFPLREHRG